MVCDYQSASSAVAKAASEQRGDYRELSVQAAGCAAPGCGAARASASTAEGVVVPAAVAERDGAAAAVPGSRPPDPFRWRATRFVERDVDADCATCGLLQTECWMRPWTSVAMDARARVARPPVEAVGALCCCCCCCCGLGMNEFVQAEGSLRLCNFITFSPLWCMIVYRHHIR